MLCLHPHLTCCFMSQFSDSWNLLTLLSHQPISDQLSCDQHLIETECFTSEKGRKIVFFMDPVSDKFYVIDLISFDLNYLNNYWCLILKNYISLLCASSTTCYNFNFFQINQFLQKMINQNKSFTVTRNTLSVMIY